MAKIEELEVSITNTVDNKRIDPFVDQSLFYTTELKEKLFLKNKLSILLSRKASQIYRWLNWLVRVLAVNVWLFLRSRLMHNNL